LKAHTLNDQGPTIFVSSGRSINTLKAATSLDKFEKEVVGRSVFEFYDRRVSNSERNNSFSLRRNLMSGLSFFTKVLKHLGFKYTKSVVS
jgi:hypothetical protein